MGNIGSAVIQEAESKAKECLAYQSNWDKAKCALKEAWAGPSSTSIISTEVLGWLQDLLNFIVQSQRDCWTYLYRKVGGGGDDSSPPPPTPPFLEWFVWWWTSWSAVFLVGGAIFFGKEILTPILELPFWIMETLFKFFYWTSNIALNLGRLLEEPLRIGWDYLEQTVAPLIGAKPALLALVGGTGVLWATLNVVLLSEVDLQRWLNSMFYTIFKVLDWPFDWMKGVLQETLGVWIGRLLGLLFLPFEVGMFILSILIGVLVYPLKQLIETMQQKVVNQQLIPLQ